MPTGEPRSKLDLFTLETPGLTASFWGGVALYTLAFFVTPYLPLIDYHQHVAIGALMHRLFDARSPEHALYEVNYITYNGGFHLLVALLSYVLPPVHAGRVVMALYPFLLAVASLSVVREAGRPRWYACLVLPLFYSRGMSWGFANWNLTFPVALTAITWFLRYSRGEKAMLPRLLLASCFCAYGHVLAMLCLCVGMGVTQLSRLRELGPTWGARAMKLISTPLPVMPGILWSVFVYRYQTRSSFSNWAEASYDGLDDPLWFKLRHLLSMSAGNTYDQSDNIILALSLGVAAILTFTGSPEPRSSDEQSELDLRAIRWLCLTFFCCYLVIPKVFIATWFIYERFPTLALVFLAGSVPLRLMPHRDELRAIAAGLGVAAGANTARVWATMGDAKDAVAIMDEVPPNRKLLAVTFDPAADRISREVFVHLAAIYQAKKPGEIAYTFTKFESMPVHYRPGKAPPSVPGGFEWDANKYDVHGAWARAYDVTMVRSPPGVEDPTLMVFREEAYRVKVMARRGRFWLYDTSALATPAFPRGGGRRREMSRRSSLLTGRKKETPPDPPALMALFYVALTVLSAGVAVIARDGHPFTHPLPWLQLAEPASLGLSLGLGVGLAGLVVLSARWSVARFAWAKRLQGDLRSTAGSLRLWQVVALATLSSLAEELFFRSLLAPAAGLFLSSLAFGLVHQVAGASRWWWAGWAGVVGLALGAIFVLTGSLVGPLVAHALINGCNLIFLRDSKPPPGASPLGGLFATRRDSARVRG